MASDFNGEIIKEFSFNEFISHIARKTRKVSPNSDDYQLVEEAKEKLTFLVRGVSTIIKSYEKSKENRIQRCGMVLG